MQKQLALIFPKRPFRYADVKFFENGQSFDNGLGRKNIIVVGNRNNPKWVHFLCPCGCKNQISLNLMKSYYPRWKLKFNADNSVSIYPSVDNSSCGSHFWIKHNKVYWAKYDTR